MLFLSLFCVSFNNSYLTTVKLTKWRQKKEKSTGRGGGQTYKEQKKQVNKHIKNWGSGTIIFSLGSSDIIPVASSPGVGIYAEALSQHCQMVVETSHIFLVFQWQLLSQLFPQWGVACPQVIEMCSVAHQLSCFGVGFSLCWFIGGLFFVLPTFSGVESEIHQLALCCQHVILVCWLFFNFAASFDFGCCSLAQQMSFVYCYLPYFLHLLITLPLSVLQPF
jgi:hypothetical protein